MTGTLISPEMKMVTVIMVLLVLNVFRESNMISFEKVAPTDTGSGQGIEIIL